MATHTSVTTREQASEVIQTPQLNETTRTETPAYEDGPTEQQVDVHGERIEALAEIICSAGEEYAGAFFVLMGMLEQSEHPGVIAHTAKHLAFTRCGEFNLFGMVDAQVGVVESELFAGSRVGY